MSTFGITNTEDAQTILDAVNYAISNLGQGSGNANVGNALVANTSSGKITTGGAFYAWLYPYIWIAYADDAIGSGFSFSPTNKGWFGQLNSTSNISGNVPDLNNPAAYSWTQVTGGFGNDKFLWYSTAGGGKIEYLISAGQPSGYYVQAQDGVAIDLQVIVSGTGLSIYQATVYVRSVTMPSAPSGGLYDFGTQTLTPPTDWYSSIPPGTDPVYTSVNSFASYSPGATVPPSTFWSDPVLSIENGQPGQDGASTYEVAAYARNATQPATPTGGSWNFGTATGVAPSDGGDSVVWTLDPPSGSIQLWVSYATASVVGSTGTDSNLSWTTPSELSGAGATGPQGPRGFIPMAYVVTASDPRTYTTSQFTTAFSASRGNITPPIGAGYPPISGDTAQFIWTAGANTPNTVQTYDGAVWSTANGQVIGGNLIVTGTINASKLAANDIYAINIQSTNANLGNINSAGYWLQSNTGNARFGGNVWIGSSLTVGNLITAGTLNPNSVSATQIASQAVTIGKIAANAVTVGTIADSAVTLGKIAAGAVGAGTIATGAVVAGTIASNAVIAGTIAAGAVTTGVIAAGAVQANAISANTMNGNIIVGNTLAGNAIVANTITAVQISSSYIYAGSIYGNQIGANTIQANSIVIGSITSTQIANNAITSNVIAANAITTIKMAANAVTAAQLAAGSVTQAAITANTISGNIIKANTLSGNTIVADTLSGNVIIGGTIAGNKILANSITSTQISSNYIYAGDIISLNAELGNISSPGYWMAYQSGNARFGGNVWIGANLTVAGLITTGQLNANVVRANNIAPGVLPGQLAANVVNYGNVTVVGNTGWEGTYLSGSTTVYYKTLSYQTIIKNPQWATTGLNPKFNVSFSNQTVATVAGQGTTEVVLYLNTSNIATITSSSQSLHGDFFNNQFTYSGTMSWATSVTPTAATWANISQITFGVALISLTNAAPGNYVFTNIAESVTI